MATRVSYLLGRLVRAIVAASRADGAGETGLNRMIWLNAASMAADAMLAVCLAGTIFFSAATSQQRGNVALYLAITMAPFAVVAPVLGPLLDRLRHGRRLALAATLIGRAILAAVMAGNFDSIALYPAAFGALVLAKAYGVLRAAALPRVMPQRLSLVSANARMSIFGLVAAVLAALLVSGLLRATGSYPAALLTTAAAFAGGAVLAAWLPKHTDAPTPATGAGEPFPRFGWAGRQLLGRHAVVALRGASAVRALSGFLALFMAFLIQSRLSGTAAAVEVGAVVAAAAAGSLTGTAIGARLPLRRPDRVVVTAVSASAAACAIAAAVYSVQTAVVVALIVGAANSLAKLALDSIIQRETPERSAASAFARSETVLQLSWVLGGAVGIALPSNGTLGFSVAAGGVGLALAALLWSRRAARAPVPTPAREAA